MKWWHGGTWIQEGAAAELTSPKGAVIRTVDERWMLGALNTAASLPPSPLPQFSNEWWDPAKWHERYHPDMLDWPSEWAAPALMNFLNLYGPLDQPWTDISVGPPRLLVHLAILDSGLRNLGQHWTEWQHIVSADRLKRAACQRKIVAAINQELERPSPVDGMVVPPAIRPQLSGTGRDVMVKAVPVTLRGRLWMYLLKKTSEQPGEYVCVDCGDDFLVPPGKRGRKPEYCKKHRNNPAAQMRVSRRRQRTSASADAEDHEEE